MRLAAISRRHGRGTRACTARACIVLATLLAAAPCFPMDPHRAGQHYAGVAYSPRSGQIAYREEHWLYELNGVSARLVLYRCASGQAFARKLVMNTPDAIAPDFDFVDARDGYREGVRGTGNTRTVYVQKSGASAMRSAPLPARQGAVIDAGFDAYVGSHWSDLAAGRALLIAFLVPSRLGYVQLKLDSAFTSVVDGAPATNLRLSLAAWYGFIAPSIELTYGTDDRRLLRFQGISNIHDSAGNSQNVRIEFPAALRFAPPAQQEIDAATAAPLVGKCAS